MPWIKLDDTWLADARVRAMGLEARALWQAGLWWSSQQITDGFLPRHILTFLAVHADVPLDQIATSAERLVALGAWHEHGHGDDCDCLDRADDCTVPDEEGWVIHRFLKYQPKRCDVVKERARKKRDRDLRSTRNEPVRTAVLARDGKRCRYCGHGPLITEGPGSKGPFRLTWDHVDPAGPNTVENLVIACKACNSRKRELTPDEAGMVLLPVPGQDVLPLADANTPDNTPPPAAASAQPSRRKRPDKTRSTPPAAPPPTKRRPRPSTKPADVVAQELLEQLTAPPPRLPARPPRPKAARTKPPPRKA